MAVKKITYDGVTLIDLTSDTVASAADIAQGKIGHLNDGTVVTGTHSGGGTSLADVKACILDYEGDEIVMTHGGYSTFGRYFTT